MYIHSCVCSSCGHELHTLYNIMVYLFVKKRLKTTLTLKII